MALTKTQKSGWALLLLLSFNFIAVNAQQLQNAPAPQSSSVPVKVNDSDGLSEKDKAEEAELHDLASKFRAQTTKMMQVNANSTAALTTTDKTALCRNVVDNWETLKLIQSGSKSTGACDNLSDLAQRTECQDMTELMQTMVKNGDMIPTIEKLRKMRRDLERIEKEMEEERRKKAAFDKTKADLIAEIDKLTEQIKKCEFSCKEWCNEMILVLLTKLKLCQQRLIKCRRDLEKCREKIALLIIEIQHLKAIIQKMVQAILWLYSKLIMLIGVIGRLKIYLIDIHDKVCGKWVQNLENIVNEMKSWCEKFPPADFSVDYFHIIVQEAREFEWTTFDKSLASMTWTVGG